MVVAQQVEGFGDGVALVASAFADGGVDGLCRWVELRGFEPLTPTLPVWCATNCAIAPEDVLIEVTPRPASLQSR